MIPASNTSAAGARGMAQAVDRLPNTSAATSVLWNLAKLFHFFAL
jgi:hypothetical protein